MFYRFIVLVAALGLIGAGAVAQDAKPPEKKEGMKAYAEIITKDAKSDSGLFIVHRVKNKWYYEIPKKEIGKEYLMVTTQSKTQTGLGYGGDELNDQVVRWDKVEDRVLLRSVMFYAVAADSLPIARGVNKATNPPILAAFDVQCYNKDSSTMVIDVSDLFTSDMTELGLNRFAREQMKIRRLDPKRSYIEKIRSFPENIETEATLTYDAGQVPMDNALSTITITVHHSMVRLPEKPMEKREFDERVGFFSTFQYDYSVDAQRAEPKRYIARWRLEPKDEAAYARGEIVEPIKPITFYVDRAVPEKWRPWLKKGIEDWQVAFEKAGFKHAIVAGDPPDPAKDPDWSFEDARIASVRWLPSNIENAYGPNITDPRTGEILDADIGFFHNVMNLARNWYFVQASASDPKAQKLPLSDSTMGELLRYICAHEVGHSLGFPHNMKASSQFPVDSLRNPAFTARYGTEASIMDYGRFNYIAQPGDGASLVPKIGPYDLFAVEWGYRRFLNAKTAEQQKSELNKIAERQEKEPYLRFGDPDGIDPTAQMEDLGDDPVKATGLGMKNINRIVDFLVSGTTKSGEDYANLREVYLELLGQRNRELVHVTSLVGGVLKTTRVAGQEGMVHTPVARARQKDAVAFVIKEGLRTPAELLRPEILRLFEPSGAEDRVAAGHRMILNSLLSNARLARLISNTALAPKGEKAYTVNELLADLRTGVWGELGGAKVLTDVFRRNLQRGYLEVMNTKLNPAPFVQPPGLPPGFTISPPPPLPGEARAMIRAELTDLDASIARAIPKSADRETKAGLEDARYQIKKILDPSSK